MITNLTTQEGNHTLLIFFTGWGTTAEVVDHLTVPRDWDYLTVYDFRDLASQHLPPLKQYDTIYLVGWSMGVWAADMLASNLPNITKAVAVNGTPLPMHNLYGIPNLIFQGTLEGLDDDNRARFNRRMCGGKKLLAVFNSFSKRSTEDLRDELIGVYQQVKGLPDNTPPALKWDKAIIGEKDLIVPKNNQIAYWEKHNVPINILEGIGHYPMMEYASWQELLDIK